MSASSSAFGRWSTAPAARAASHRVRAARVAEHDHLRARILLEQLAHDRLAGERAVEQHGVVRVLRDGRERGADAGDPVHLRGRGIEQLADQAAVGLIGRDEEKHEGRLGHGPGSDSTSASKTEQ